MKTSNRIETIKSLVPRGARLLDIGGDHALLPVSLFLDKAICCAVVTDIRPGPLARSRVQLEKFCPAARYSLVLSDGFKAVDPNSFDFAAICGMGGELIGRIIEEGGEKARRPMVLQPMTGSEKLRKYLWDNGFEIENEVFVRENPADENFLNKAFFSKTLSNKNPASQTERVYVIMLVKPCEAFDKNAKIPYTHAEMYLGKIRSPGKDFAAYAKKAAKAAEKRLIGLKIRGEDTSETERLIKEAENAQFFT